MFHGLRTGPSRGLAAALKPNSDIWVLPSEVSPVARYNRVNSPSATASCGAHASAPTVSWPATSTLSLRNVGTPPKNPPARLPAAVVRLVKRLVGQSVQGGIDRLGAGDRGVDDLGSADPPGSDSIGEAYRVEVTEDIVTEGVHVSHDNDASPSGPRAVRA